MTRVAVVGARGRMGSRVCDAVEADPDLDLVARVGSGDRLDLVLDAGADVAVEFTLPTNGAAPRPGEACQAQGVPRTGI